KDFFAAVGSACRRPAPLQRLDLETRSSKRFSKAIVFEARYGGFGAQKSRTARPPRGCPEPSRLEGHVTAVSLIKICFRIVAAGCIIRKISEAVEDERARPSTSMVYQVAVDLALTTDTSRKYQKRAEQIIPCGGNLP